MEKKIILSLTLVTVLLTSIFSPTTIYVQSEGKSKIIKEVSYAIGRGSGGARGLTVEFAYPADGDVLEPAKLAVDVKATGKIAKVEVKIEKEGLVIVDWTDITNTKSGDYYVFYPFDAIALGTYTIYARATDTLGRSATKSISIKIVEHVTLYYELFVEIDYFEGHAPTGDVLVYVKNYYDSRGIKVALIQDDVITSDALAKLGVNPADGINDAEFWIIEKKYNDELYYDDQAQDGYDADGDGYDKEYFLKEKWFLYGNGVEGEPNVVSYIYVFLTPRDLLAGNYAFIADEVADSWAVSKVEPYGAEVVVIMHELGHSIGIAKIRGLIEVYDPDPFSVMSTLRIENARLYDAWHYSNEYWSTKNLGYYTIS